MIRIYALAALAIVAIATPAAAQPSPEQLIDRAIQAQGSPEEFRNFGVLRMEVDGTETMLDGSTRKDVYTAYLDTTFKNSRIETPNNVVVVKNDSVGWATINGKVDQRQQSPRFSVGFNHEKIFPVMLPHSLKMDGVVIGEVAHENTFGGKPAWSFTVAFEKMFFVTPLINDRWEVFVSREDGRYLGARFMPVAEYQDVQPEGMQYTPVAYQTVDGVEIPSQVVVDGIDASGTETGHVSVVKIEAEALYEPGIAYFLSPDRLAEIEG